VAAYNYPNERGERVLDSFLTIREALPSLSPHLQSVAEVLLAELGLAVEWEAGEGESTPYALARVEDDGTFALYHHEREVWVPLDELEAMRPSPPSKLGRVRKLVEGFELGDEPEARFEEATGERLTHAVATLIERGENDLAERIARHVLEHEARFELREKRRAGRRARALGEPQADSLRQGDWNDRPTTSSPVHWWGLLGESRLARGAFDDETREVIGRALFYMESGSPTVPALMYRWYEGTGADLDTRALVFYGLQSYCHRLGTEVKRPHAPKPKRLKSRFGAIFAEWFERYWPGVDGFDDGELLHLISVIDALAKRPLNARRKELRARLDERERRSV